MNFPENLKYSTDHEWVKVEGNIAVIGVTDHAQSELGDIAYVDIAEDTTTLTANEVFGTIEAVKAVSDLVAPVSGKVVAINESLNDDPAVVNDDPYGKGWMVKVEMSNPAELDELMDAAAYKNMIG
ncbi:MAG: glycine cleavage system protein GcvH [Ignavibacteria bacterium]|jgi:glycine cleavage system H protein|nr:glycine cleavage system protein GcvH [Ignavibacteria bacterium]